MAVTLETIEPGRLNSGRAIEIPDGSAIVVRRGPYGVDVTVTPSKSGDRGEGAPVTDLTGAPCDDERAAGDTLHVRGMSVSLSSDAPSLCTLEIVDGRGVRRRYRLHRSDLALLIPSVDGATPPAAGPADPDDAHTAALARRANAEAELLEIQAETARRPLAVDEKPLVAQSWALERVKDANGAPAFLVALKGNGRSVQAQLTGHFAATLGGQLGLMASELLAELQKAR